MKWRLVQEFHLRTFYRGLRFRGGHLAARSTSRLEINHAYNLPCQRVRAVGAEVKLAIRDDNVTPALLPLIEVVNQQRRRDGRLLHAAVPRPCGSGVSIARRRPDAMPAAAAGTEKQQVRGVRARQSFDSM